MAKDRIYVISTGVYSDYHLICYCPNKKEADQLAARLNDAEGAENYRVEWLPLATGDVPLSRHYVGYARINLEDGSIISETEKVTEGWPPLGWEKLGMSWTWWRGYGSQATDGGLSVIGTDVELAQKVYSEKRAQLIADPVMRSKPDLRG